MSLIARVFQNPGEYLSEVSRIADEVRSKRKLCLPPEIQSAFALSEALEQIQSRFGCNSELSDEGESPVFVCSAGWRSGSTLLQRLLISSGELALWGEPLGGAAIIPSLAHSLTWINSQWPPDEFMQAKKGSLRELSGSWIANLTPPLFHLRRAHQHFLKQWLGVAAFQNYAVPRWGFKEVRLTIDHARYLKWLFPKAKFFFIYRDLFNAYRSWKGNHWDDAWPNYHSRSPIIFAKHWKKLLSGYLAGCNSVDGMLVKFEDLVGGNIPLNVLAQHGGLSWVDPGVLQKKIASPSPVSTDQAKPRVAVWEELLLKSIGGKLYARLYP